MPIGNDIVDLRDAEAGLGSLHPRFARRVLTAPEHAAVCSSNEPVTALWAHWAAKESAYKAVRQVDPSALFSPSRYVVGLMEPPRLGIVSGTVRCRDHQLTVEIVTTDEWVHAVAHLDMHGEPNAQLAMAEVHRTPACLAPSAAVRRAALDAAARLLGIPTAELRIAGARPPLLCHAHAGIPLDLSLSHHGAWIAFALAPHPPRQCRVERRRSGALNP